GENAFSSGLKELKQLGYVKKERRRNQSGKFEWVTVVYEVPQNDEPSSDLPHMENASVVEPSMEKPSVENQELLNTNLVSTNLLNTDLLKNNDEQATPINAITFYHENGFGILSSYIREKIAAWIDAMGDELVIHAMKLAIENNVVRWNYVETILKGWSQQNVKTLAQAEEAKRRFAMTKNKHAQQKQGRYVEIVPEWFHKTPSQKALEPSVKNEEMDIEAETEKLFRAYRESTKRWKELSK
ncbi:DnaD domain-containing protein, partial [Metasolibacillus meyeri]|uniref:DnaD domain-containing protein n=1 Tax=Metasolibacillus meyeri TaxID=1071052 RepID=UPI000D2FC322